MLARIRKAMEEKDEGFTLIELLVVIIIIGILAAIAIPVFLNQRKKGYDAQTKSDVKNLSTSMETYATDYNGLYPVDASGNAYTNQDATTITALGFGKSTNDTNIVFSDTTGSNGGYVLAGKSDSGNVFCFQSANSNKGVYKSNVSSGTRSTGTYCP